MQLSDNVLDSQFIMELFVKSIINCSHLELDQHADKTRLDKCNSFLSGSLLGYWFTSFFECSFLDLWRCQLFDDLIDTISGFLIVSSTTLWLMRPANENVYAT